MIVKSASKKKVNSDPIKYIYTWGAGEADGHGEMKELLGGKGANLAEMTLIGLPVPAGFTITTEVCTYYYDHKKTYPKVLRSQMEAGVANMEKIMGYKFGDSKGFPLLLAVRSGAREPMPGMMDTVLNLGLNNKTVDALSKGTKNECFAWDCYRRFIQTYGDVVLGVQKAPDEDHDPFEFVIESFMHAKYKKYIVDSELTAADNKELVVRFKKLVHDRTGKGFPEDPWEQLEGAAGAVFSSWMNDRAIVYRHKYGIPAAWGTALNVQAMVFGNTGSNSGSGVAFTRNPANGENVLYGEFLVNAQGEDVVAGVRTPDAVAGMAKALPAAFKELMKVRCILENHFRDVQDVEFTIQDGKLFMLQTRNGKRSAAAALKFAADMVKEKLIDWETAVLRIPADVFVDLLAPVVKDKTAKKVAVGLGGWSGAVSGRIYMDLERAIAANKRGERVILIINEIRRDNLAGVIAASGILTSYGGISSVAAIVARRIGKPYVCGASAVIIDCNKRTVIIAGKTFNEGDLFSIDGSTGGVYSGNVLESSELVAGLFLRDENAQKTEKFKNFVQLMKWCAVATDMPDLTDVELTRYCSLQESAMVAKLATAQASIRKKRALGLLLT